MKTHNVPVPEFIIVVPTYNRASLLPRLINSVLSQSYPKWTLLLNDDGGSDNTKEVVEHYSVNERRIRYYRMDQNSGVNATRNRLIDIAQAMNPDSYLIFIDDDDYLTPNALSTAAELINKQPGYSWYLLDCIYEDGKPETKIRTYGELSYLNDYMFGKSLRGDVTNIIKAKAIEQDRFTTHFRNAEEWYLWCHLSQRFNLFAENKPGSVKEYLPGGLSHSGMNRDKAIEVMKFKIDTLEPMVGRKRMLHQYVTLAKHLLRDNQVAEAKKILTLVFQCSPFYLRQYRHWLKVAIGL